MAALDDRCLDALGVSACERIVIELGLINAYTEIWLFHSKRGPRYEGCRFSRSAQTAHD
jgi:hypothetical protein